MSIKPTIIRLAPTQQSIRRALFSFPMVYCVFSQIVPALAQSSSVQDFLYLVGLWSPTYYVNAATGNDSSPGTQAQPWQTLRKVNSFVFRAHTVVYLQGSFSGGDNGLILTTMMAPQGNIKISGYGSGATINSGNSTACLSAVNVRALTVANFSCVGGGNTNNSTAGISIINDGSVSVYMTGPNVTGMMVWGYGGSCIIVKGTSGNSGFRNVNVSSNVVHDCTGNGVVFDSCITAAGSGLGTDAGNFNVTIQHNTAYNCNGTAGLSNWSGSGILVDDTRGALIQYNVAHDFGASQTYCGGAVGIGAYQVANAVIQFNEAYNGKTGAGGCDGDGFDLDGGAIDLIMQYNYAHDNVGAGFLVAAYSGTVNANSVARFNISQNDGVISGALSTFAEDATASVTGCQIYNNTAFTTKGAAFFSSVVGGGIACQVSNNVLYQIGGSIIEVAASNQNFTGNDYYGSGGIVWSGATYKAGTVAGTVSAWQSATGQEKISGRNVGHTFEPRLVVYGGGGAIGAYIPASLPQYEPQVGSPIIAAGLNLSRQYRINPGTQDFYGNRILTTSLPIGAAAQAITWPSLKGTCSRATSFLTRMKAPSTSLQEQVNGVICGLVADGTFSSMDVFYDFLMDVRTNANLNMIANADNITVHGNPTFTAFGGYSGSGVTTDYLTTNYSPAGSPNFTTNSAAFGVCVLNARSIGSAGVAGGSVDGSGNSIFIQPFTRASNFQWQVNGKLVAGGAYSNSSTRGDWIVARISATQLAVALDGAAQSLVDGNSTEIPNVSVTLLAGNNHGSIIDASTDTLGFVWFGSTPSIAQAMTIHSRIHAATVWADQNGC